METARQMWLHSEMENKRNESSISLRRVRRVSQACYIHSEIFTLQRVIHTKMVQSPSPSPPPSPMQRWCWDAAQLWVKAYVDNFFGYFQILFFLLQILFWDKFDGRGALFNCFIKVFSKEKNLITFEPLFENWIKTKYPFLLFSINCW